MSGSSAGRLARPGPLPNGARRGVLFALATDFPEPPPGKLAEWRERFPEHRAYKGADLALVPTVFDKLDPVLCPRTRLPGLVARGCCAGDLSPGPAAVARLDQRAGTVTGTVCAGTVTATVCAVAVDVLPARRGDRLIVEWTRRHRRDVRSGDAE